VRYASPVSGTPIVFGVRSDARFSTCGAVTPCGKVVLRDAVMVAVDPIETAGTVNDSV
jgi:hypothetical protein